MKHRSGRHFLQIPGPTNVPDRVLRAIDHATIDHRSQDFGELGRAVLAGLKPVFGTSGPVIILPSSGTGAWEAALVNTLSPGEAELMFETWHFATLWGVMYKEVAVETQVASGEFVDRVDPGRVAEKPPATKAHPVQ